MSPMLINKSLIINSRNLWWSNRATTPWISKTIRYIINFIRSVANNLELNWNHLKSHLYIQELYLSQTLHSRLSHFLSFLYASKIIIIFKQLKVKIRKPFWTIHFTSMKNISSKTMLEWDASLMPSKISSTPVILNSESYWTP